VVFGGDAGYSPKHPPTVALLSGTSAPGVRTAILAPATVSNGGVNFVRVIDGGTGYVGPIAVIVAPGIPNKYVVPIWAPAGALKSSTRDMISFAQAALGHLVVNGVRLDPRLRSAFQMAQKGYACETAGQRPCLSLSGLAWSSNPGDGGMAAGVSKNGGLPGFTTDVRLAPSLDLGVVVFVNSNQREETANGKKPGASADLIADNILYAIARANQR
jgi:CubicO group peptidase (beta-lactamase class C family)